jgi:hypothetical protein
MAQQNPKENQQTMPPGNPMPEQGSQQPNPASSDDDDDEEEEDIEDT